MDRSDPVLTFPRRETIADWHCAAACLGWNQGAGMSREIRPSILINGPPEAIAAALMQEEHRRFDYQRLSAISRESAFAANLQCRVTVYGWWIPAFQKKP
jgi:hypothetical protein